MPANADKILELIFSGGTALAGLILVFLGFVITSFESYKPEEQSAVRPKYKSRALRALGGFFASIFAAILALIAYASPCAVIFYSGLAALGFAFIMVSWVAIIVVSDVW